MRRGHILIARRWRHHDDFRPKKAVWLWRIRRKHKQELARTESRATNKSPMCNEKDPQQKVNCSYAMKAIRRYSLSKEATHVRR